MVRFAWLAVFVVVGIFSCVGGESWRVRDASGQAQSINDIRFEPLEKLEFRVGNSHKWIEANQIRWLSVDPSQMITDAGRVYYGAKLILQDGSHYPDSASTDTVGGVMIPADGLLVGSAQQLGRVELPLSQLRELGTVEYYAPPEKEKKEAKQDTTKAKKG